MNNYIRIPATDIRTFISNVFERLGVSSPDAAIASDVLVQADLRGVDSHGMNNLFQYIDPLRSGELNPQPIVKAITETPTTVLLDGDGGMGLVVGVKAMELCIGKAYQCGVGIATVRRSRHFGMAAYHSMLGLKHNMIGFALTNNSSPGILPTYGKRPNDVYKSYQHGRPNGKGYTLCIRHGHISCCIQ